MQKAAAAAERFLNVGAFRPAMETSVDAAIELLKIAREAHIKAAAYEGEKGREEEEDRLLETAAYLGNMVKQLKQIRRGEIPTGEEPQL